jgi:predicted flap endonuclease-1-like 5' DNA nuclease
MGGRMRKRVNGFTIGLILGLITFLLIILGNKKEKERITDIPVLTPVKPETRVIPAEDDLTVIEGIGPKTAALLKENGITTFALLATTEISFLEKMLRDKGWQFAKPKSWPEQASLAAKGKIAEL